MELRKFNSILILLVASFWTVAGYAAEKDVGAWRLAQKAGTRQRSGHHRLSVATERSDDEWRQGSVGHWGFGLHVGPSFYTQDPGPSASGGVGPEIKIGLLYDLTESFSLGFDFSWEMHGLDVFSTDVGNVHTFSVMPLLQYRFVNLHRFSPYVSLGIGYNVNIFRGKSAFRGVPSPDNTIAIKPAIGLDYFLLDNLALGADFSWKWNDSGILGDDYNGSTMQMLFGARYYF